MTRAAVAFALNSKLVDTGRRFAKFSCASTRCRNRASLVAIFVLQSRIKYRQTWESGSPPWSGSMKP
jgi:hypothetical protein